MAIRYLLGLMALLLVSTASYAADKGGTSTNKIRADVQDPPAAVAYNWSSCYVSALGSIDKTSSDVLGGLMTSTTTDPSFGAGFGCTWQIPSTLLVLGADLDYMFQHANTAMSSFDSNWSGTARAGLLISPSMLAYALAGYTRTDGSFPSSLPATGLSFPDHGLTWGLGLEAFITKNLTLKAEWRTIDLGDVTPSGSPVALFSNHQDSVRLGLSYRFSGGMLER